MVFPVEANELKASCILIRDAHRTIFNRFKKDVIESSDTNGMFVVGPQGTGKVCTFTL